MSTNVSEKRPPEQKPEGSRAFASGSKGGRFGDQLFSGLSLAAGILIFAILLAVFTFLGWKSADILTIPGSAITGGEGFFS